MSNAIILTTHTNIYNALSPLVFIMAYEVGSNISFFIEVKKLRLKLHNLPHVGNQ